MSQSPTETANETGASKFFKLAAALCWMQVGGVVVAAVAAAVEIESIIWSCPAIACVGFLLAALSLRRYSINALLFGLFGPAMTAVIALLISSFDWSPKEAQQPVVGVLTLHALIATLWGGSTAWRLRRDAGSDMGFASSTRFRFSTRSLLILITAACPLFALLPLFERKGEMWWFAGYGIGVLVICLTMMAWFALRASSAEGIFRRNADSATATQEKP